MRLRTAIPVTTTFSEPVNGFAASDVTVANGTVSNFVGSDGDSVFTFDVTPNAVGVVTVDIAAGVAQDSDGNGNTTAAQLSLGLPYDDDHDGVISRARSSLPLPTTCSKACSPGTRSHRSSHSTCSDERKAACPVSTYGAGFHKVDLRGKSKEHRARKEKLKVATEEARELLAERRQFLDSTGTVTTVAAYMSEFLKTSELTRTRTFVHSFVMEIRGQARRHLNRLLLLTAAGFGVARGNYGSSGESS